MIDLKTEWENDCKIVLIMQCLHEAYAEFKSHDILFISALFTQNLFIQTLFILSICCFYYFW